ncbi:sigma-54-dependent transcriptional regulator [Parabacteroides pacaensis]|uniref:sigma-54-dependent transcriptional regulator n=1 Tax=Parabacteroides pacaensis TaxID=2086575 RepID=UPI000D10EBB1|nr:sigma-54 dependent transcriptional regulator [Parabacteroides pacaensis]
MDKQGTVVIVDDNKAILEAAQMLLNTNFSKVITMNSPNTLLTMLGQMDVDIVLMDMNFSAGINNGNEGLYWLKEVKKHAPTVEVILFTAYADIDLAVKGIKEGATDFIVKPWNNTKLLSTLRSAYELRKKKLCDEETNATKNEIPNEPSMYWGESEIMLKLYSLVKKVSQTDANILITGENGTGKEMLAREIHKFSNRKNEPLVCVDMGAITETLFESELFGHVKGAFTDAHADRKGLFEIASGGSLFLDEIGNLPYHLQAKLLTAIQRRAVLRVGSSRSVPVNIRLICATNKNLQKMVDRGTFREDLLYRINTIHIEIPPLRERRLDILPLAEMFIARYAEKYNKENCRISPEAAGKLMAYPWYGNIRELEHTIEKAVIISEGNVLKADSFTFQKKDDATGKAIATLEEMEKEMIRKAIDKFQGNLSSVAGELGISRQTLYNKMKKYEI